MITKCHWCHKEFNTYPSLLKMGYDKFCSRSCHTMAQKGQPVWHSGKHGVYSKETLKKMSVAKLGYIPWNKGKKLPQFTGENSPCWKGGTIGKNGYHYMCIDNKRILKHRYIMEKYLNRLLKKQEIVHHIDGNPLNNEISNLMIFPNQSAHKKYHQLLFRNKLSNNITSRINS